MDILFPKDKRSERFQNIRPLTAPEKVQKSPSSGTNSKPNSRRRNNSSPQYEATSFSSPNSRYNSRPGTAQWNMRKPKVLTPLSLERDVIKARRVLDRAVTEDFTKVNKIGSPGGHIARIEADKKGERSPGKIGQKMFCFSENVDDLMSYHTRETVDRPQWSNRFTRDHLDKAEKEIERRKKKRAKQKSMDAGLNAINLTMHDIVAMYTTVKADGIQGSSHPSPVHLNDDEMHVWQRLRVSLHHTGQFFSHKALDEVAIAAYRLDAPIHPIFAHFLQYMNIVLGGTSSLSTARLILLKDVSYVLKLIQEVDHLKLPLDNLREATAFRIREMNRLGQQLLPAPSCPSTADLLSVTSTLSGDVMTIASLDQRSSVFTVSDEKTVQAKQAAQQVLFHHLSNWLFSFSLLAKIALVSGERTPLNVLLAQKKKNANGAVTVVPRRISTKYGCAAHNLFRSHTKDQDEIEDDMYRERTIIAGIAERTESRRASLSMLLASSGCYERYSDKELSIERIETDLTEDDIAILREEFFGVGPAATSFHAIDRKSAASYGNLETLLKPMYSDPVIDIDSGLFPVTNVKSESGGESVSRSLNEEELMAILARDDERSRLNTGDTDASPLPEDLGDYVEMGCDDKKYRFNKKGEMYMTDSKGRYKKCEKDMSLYYDMLTEEEAMGQINGAHNTISGVDVFNSSSSGYMNDTTSLSPRSRYEEAKKKRMADNSDFVDTLARVTELQLHPLPSESSISSSHFDSGFHTRSCESASERSDSFDNDAAVVGKNSCEGS